MLFPPCSLGANELAVQKAKAEITRLIKEELIRLVSENLKDLFVLVNVLLGYNVNIEKYTNHKHSSNLHKVRSTLMLSLCFHGCVVFNCVTTPQVIYILDFGVILVFGFLNNTSVNIIPCLFDTH